MNHKHKHRTYHRAAAYNQAATESNLPSNVDSMMEFINATLERDYAIEERRLMLAINAGDKSYTIKSMIGNGADVLVDLRDRHPSTFEPLDTE